MSRHKAAVLTRYPHAVAVRESLHDAQWGEWMIYDIPVSMAHGVRWRGDVAVSPTLIAASFVGEEEAWIRAMYAIEIHECKPARRLG